ncbi:MAG: imidazoleglycerol-phosphate dehydratase HisB [Clostridia bacterium]|nr:imidazoleglycerol-phosphate dehydratase HisB [Clostridia bacterium]MBR2908528.1 imidazoleglycerol-phosphate dehydratase HisB [Clostridia bacterium]
MRTAEIKRTTKETDIRLSLSLDGTGKGEIKTGVGFLDHMLTLFASHGRFDLTVRCNGDTEVDDHHSVEDIAICLGQALREALGDCKGINRYGSMLLPMDEALVRVVIDVSGRPYLAYRMDIPTEKVGSFDTELVEEFLLGFVRSAGITLHVAQLDGSNSHHIIEGLFKALGRALRGAVRLDPDRADEIPSTKGSLL